MPCWTATGSATPNASPPKRPVPVVRISRTEERLGGAANVAVNIASIGARSSLLCVVGNDEPGHRLERFASEQGIAPHFQFDDSLDTTVKLRVVARQQQMLRCDFESLLRKRLSTSISTYFAPCSPNTMP